MMIGWEDIYKVLVAMLPLYFALMLGYGSVRWWAIFNREHCEAISRLVSFFTLPLFTFSFTSHIDPFEMNYRFIAADAISKVVIVVVLAAWAKCSSKGSYCWSITSFSLSTLTNALVVGVPLLKAMYGPLGEELVVQASVLQAIIWLTILLFVLELRQTSRRVWIGPTRSEVAPSAGGLVKDVESNKVEEEVSGVVVGEANKPAFWSLMKMVWLKLALNPNSYASIVGVVWAFISNRWHVEMPSIVDGSVQILSTAGRGMAILSLGMFMANQEKVIACGVRLTITGMVLRFIGGPAAMAIGAIAMGMRGDALRIAIIQAAVPQSITSFIYAQEYGLHAEVLSTAVIFGMLASLPVLIAYYVCLEFLS